MRRSSQQALLVLGFEIPQSGIMGVSLDIPKELQAYYEEFTTTVDTDVMKKVSNNLHNAVYDIESYLNENKELIEDYMKYIQTAAYKETASYQMTQFLRQFQKESGYQDIFIPAMCRLSQSYRKYYEALQKANEIFLHKYPEWDKPQNIH